MFKATTAGILQGELSKGLRPSWGEALSCPNNSAPGENKGIRETSCSLWSTATELHNSSPGRQNSRFLVFVLSKNTKIFGLGLRLRIILSSWRSYFWEDCRYQRLHFVDDLSWYLSSSTTKWEKHLYVASVLWIYSLECPNKYNDLHPSVWEPEQ